MRTVIVLATLLLVPLAAASLPSPVPVVAAGATFASPVLAIPVGGSVEWIGAALPHTVTTANDALAARDGRANDNGNSDGSPDTFNVNLPMGATYTHTFNEEGTFTYFCDLHYRLGMVGVIVVG